MEIFFKIKGLAQFLDIMTTPVLRRNFQDAIAEQKANFLAVISHELRTPMQSIYGLLELIEQDNTNRTMQDLIHAAQGSATLMLDLLDDILDFARLDANKLELEQLELPIRTLIQGVVEAMRVRVGTKPITLDATIDPDIPTIILGDPKRLRQILFNLVGNALKFTTRGHVHLRAVYAPSSFPDQTNIRFEIEDTGIGIDTEVQHQLFQPFTQGDSTVARKYGGAGLGLSICERLVSLMGGEIGVRSTLGQGSTFWFEIPCVSSLYDHLETTIDLTGLHVLAIESHPNAALEIERSLRNMNADVDVVATIDEARRKLTRYRFDVAMTDYILPDGNGVDFIRDLTKTFPRMGLVMYTFYEHDGLAQSLKSMGVTYLPKPASRIGLAQTLLDVAKRHWLEQTDIPQRVLLAEDTASVRQILQTQFERMGVIVDVVEDGFKALEKAQTIAYGLIITDLHMPELDGYALAEKIRASEPAGARTPIILLTADIQLSDRAAYLRRGFDDCLNKPVTFQHLRHALQRWGINVDLVPTQETNEEVGLSDPHQLINIAQLMRQIEGTRNDAVVILKSFPVMSAPLIDRLHHTDASNVAEAAHSLKGAARFACCQQLANLCDITQRRAESGQIDHDTIKQIEATFAELCAEIKAL